MSDDAKKAILARRARFLAAALAGTTAVLGAGTATEACGGETEKTPPQPCLGPQACLDPYTPPADGGPDVRRDAADDGDAGPQVCLVPPLGDGGDSGGDAPGDGNNEAG